MGEGEIDNDDNNEYVYLPIGREHSRIRGWKFGLVVRR